MKLQTLEKFSALQAKLCKSYAVKSVAQMFNVTAPRAIALINQVQLSIEFLKRISMLPTIDKIGDVVTLNAPAGVAGNTNTATAGKKRIPRRIGAVSGRTYECKKTNFDCAIGYDMLDTWARFTDFEKRLLTMFYRAQGLSMLLVGWYGMSYAENSDPETNPLMQDVNTGWLYDLLTNKPENYLTKTDGKYTLGRNGDWRNLNHLVYDLHSLIPEEHRTGNEIALVGRGMITWESGKIFANHGDTPSEMANFSVLDKSYGGLPATCPAHFPDNGVMVVDPANLQIYFQDSSIRRQVADHPEADQVEHFMSGNYCWRIGDLDAAAAIDAAKVEYIDNPDPDPIKVIPAEGAVFATKEQVG